MTIALYKLIAALVIAIITTFSSAQANDKPIIGDDLTLSDIAYSNDEVEEFQVQLKADKRKLEQYYLTTYPGATKEEFQKHYDKLLQHDQHSSSLLSNFYLKQIDNSDTPSISDVRMLAFLNHDITAKSSRALDRYFIGIKFAYCKPVLSVKDTKRFLYWLTQAANSNEDDNTYVSSAAYAIGLHYYYELDRYPNNARLKALTQSYLAKSAEAGNIGGAYILSRYYRHEEKNLIKGVKWLKIAAEGDIPEAKGELAFIYLIGDGVKADYQKTLYWAKKGINANDPLSFTIIGLLYENGWGIEMDPFKALSNYAKACDLGNEIGCEQHNRLYFVFNQPTFEEQNGFYSK